MKRSKLITKIKLDVLSICSSHTKTVVNIFRVFMFTICFGTTTPTTGELSYFTIIIHALFSCYSNHYNTEICTRTGALIKWALKPKVFISVTHDGNNYGITQGVQWLGYRLNNPRFESQQERQIFLFSKAFRQGPPSQPPTQCMPGVLSLGHLTTFPHTVSRSRVSGPIPLLPIHACKTFTGKLPFTMTHTRKT